MKTALAGLLLLVCVPLCLARPRPRYPMNVSAAGARVITFDVQEGDFVLRGDPAATSVRMMVGIDRFFLFKLGEEGILQRLIKVEGENTPELTIRTDIPRAVSNWGRAEYPIDFEVIVPANVTLRVRDTSGKIEIRGMSGAVEIHDTSGTLSVRNLAGPLTIDKESGDIAVTDVAGATRIASHSGQMRLARLADLQITSSDGNLDITGVAAARLTNRGGNIRVTGVKGDLAIDDDTGEIVLDDVSGQVTIRDTSGQIRATRTGPITVNDTSGDIVVSRAASLDVVTKEGGQVKVAGVSGEVRVPAGTTLIRH